MKRIAGIVIFLMLVSSLRGQAQSFELVTADDVKVEDVNRTADGKVLRGSYLTNEWYDNWSFGGAFGLQFITAPMNEGIVPTFVFDVSAVKWMTPSIATRFVLSGFSLKEKRPYEFLYSHSQLINENGVNMFRQTWAGHIDIMFSISNAIFGYRPNRFWNCIPYVGGGFMRLADSDGSFFAPQKADRFYYDREFLIGGGVYNTFKITDHLYGTLDLRDMGFRSAYHTTKNGVGMAQNFAISGGLSYTIHKWYWSRHQSVMAPIQATVEQANQAIAEVKKQNEELEHENTNLVTRNTLLQQQVVVLKQKPTAQTQDNSRLVVSPNTYITNRPMDELERRASEAGLVLYFEINSDKISAGEMIRLEQYVQEMNRIDPLHVFYITGSADEGTGNVTINTRLSRSRGEQVRKVLLNKLKVPKSQVVLKPSIISHQHEDGRLDRCVLLENQ